MHVTTKEVDEDGVHVLTSVIEGDGPLPIASEKARISARVLSFTRTDSGGVQVVTQVSIQEPAPTTVEAPAPPPTDEEVASAYLVTKGAKKADADAQVVKFGAARILKARDEALDAELASQLNPGGTQAPAKPAAVN